MLCRLGDTFLSTSLPLPFTLSNIIFIPNGTDIQSAESDIHDDPEWTDGDFEIITSDKNILHLLTVIVELFKFMACIRTIVHHRTPFCLSITQCICHTITLAIIE